MKPEICSAKSPVDSDQTSACSVVCKLIALNSVNGNQAAWTHKARSPLILESTESNTSSIYSRPGWVSFNTTAATATTARSKVRARERLQSHVDGCTSITATLCKRGAYCYHKQPSLWWLTALVAEYVEVYTDLINRQPLYLIRSWFTIRSLFLRLFDPCLSRCNSRLVRSNLSIISF